jgi:hypothetical protein
MLEKLAATPRAPQVDSPRTFPVQYLSAAWLTRLNQHKGVSLWKTPLFVPALAGGYCTAFNCEAKLLFPAAETKFFNGNL